MTNRQNAPDETADVRRDCNPDLRFIDTVLTDMIVFARLNHLAELEDDLEVARARFVAEVGPSYRTTQLAD